MTSLATTVHRRVVLLGLASVLLVVPAPALATDYTWSGAAPPDTPNWSSGDNWNGGTAPSGSVGTLSFPVLGSTSCAGFPYAAACYKSQNDVPGLTANSLVIGEGKWAAKYGIGGAPIVLGGGGITATPDAGTTTWTSAEIGAPISLSAPQTWTINGSNYLGRLDLNGDVTGASDALGVNLTHATLAVGADVEAGAISVTGPGSVYLGNPSGPPFFAGSLNGSNGNPVDLGPGVSMFDQNSIGVAGNTKSVGELTAGEHSYIQVGQPENFGAVTLGVNGRVTLSPRSSLSLLFGSQIRATGPVDLGGAELTVEDGTTHYDGSPSCNALTEDTLITTTGLLSGTFQGIPEGTVMPVTCAGSAMPPEARFNYTAHAVTAILVQRTTTAIDVSNPTPSVGHSVTLTATVTPEKDGAGLPAGTVEFEDRGQPIQGCVAQPLTPGKSSSNAQCDLQYQTIGTHSVTATYRGAQTYAGSTSTPQAVIVGGSGAPNTVIRSHPKRRLMTMNVANISFSFSSTMPDATFECKLGGVPFAPCTSPKTYKVKPGRYTFKVLAEDGGYADTTPAIFRFRVEKKR